MNKEKLNELRSKISIPLAEAVNLLKQYDENIEQCIQAFHAENIKKICEQTACEQNIVFEYYHDVAYGYDIEKVLNKVFAYMRKPIKLTIGENPDDVEKVGFFIWAEDEKLVPFQYDKNKTYFIPSYDFSYVIEIFESVFPLYNPMRKNSDSTFDIYSYNFFDQQVMQQILMKIKCIDNENAKVERFLTRLSYILEEKMKMGHYVVITGNL